MKKVKTKKKSKTKDTHHHSDPLLTKIRRGAEKPEEFKNAQEWVEEQKEKLAEIEEMVTELLHWQY